MNDTLQRSNRRVRHYHVDAAIGTLLAQLGLEYSSANFWTENGYILEEILHDAFVAYRERIIQVAPRASGDDQVEAAGLNSLWSEIKRRFHQHMHPQLSPKASIQRKAQVYHGGKFLRHCLWEKCGQQFFTEDVRKVYCCPQHKRNQWLAVARKLKAARQITVRRNCKRKQCRKHFTAVLNSGKVFCSRRCDVRFYDLLRKKKLRNEIKVCTS